MGSFPETYNDPNRLRIGSSGCTVYRLAKLFRSSYCAKVGERERERERESNHEKRNEGRGGGGEETLPRKPHDSIKRAMICLCFLFSSFVSFTQYSGTRSETLVTQATGFHVFPLEISCRDFSLSSPTSYLVSSYEIPYCKGIVCNRAGWNKNDSHPPPRLSLS